MNCQTCGREPENGRPTHWLGCKEILRALVARQAEAKTAEERELAEQFADDQWDTAPEDQCSHGGCHAPKKEWSGRGAKPKFCTTGHKKEK